MTPDLDPRPNLLRFSPAGPLGGGKGESLVKDVVGFYPACGSAAPDEDAATFAVLAKGFELIGYRGNGAWYRQLRARRLHVLPRTARP